MGALGGKRAAWAVVAGLAVSTAAGGSLSGAFGASASLDPVEPAPAADAEPSDTGPASPAGRDLSTTASARTFALDLLNGRLGEGEDAEALLKRARANLPSYRTAGPPADAALIEAVVLINGEAFEDAVEAAERAAELAAGDPDAHYVLGSALITEVSSGSFGFSTLGKVNRARSAWKRSVELDPEHVGSRISLAMYYLNAPGIAGGDKTKAEEYGESLIETGDTAWGRRILMMVSLKRKRWDEARERLDTLVRASETDADKRDAYRSYVVPVLLEHEREDDAIAVLPALERVSEPGDATVAYLWGRAYQERDDRGDRGRAIEAYARAIEANAEARDSRWRLAELLRKEDRDAEAAVHYAAFAERFPDHDDAKKARRYAERLSR